MEAQTSISMNRVSHLTRDAYRRDKDRNLVFHSQRDVLGQPRVRFVDGKLRRPRRVSGRQPVPYVFQPILIASGGSLLEIRKVQIGISSFWEIVFLSVYFSVFSFSFTITFLFFFFFFFFFF